MLDQHPCHHTLKTPTLKTPTPLEGLEKVVEGFADVVLPMRGGAVPSKRSEQPTGRDLIHEKGAREQTREHKNARKQMGH